ncbi:IS91 family transposase [Acidiphilium acidophilum]|uniref:IS91 family transposase n=1 Tax=Acidiphilium acidophilum TaxID=76588 RepID=UPI002E8E789C|nr:IS91 family transposase [Acidiphilium acidophilum]
MRPAIEVADVFRRHGARYRRDHQGHIGRVERRVMTAIETCRTPVLGGHAEQCGDCGLLRCAYNSCRNRHCPKCQGLARAEWLEARQAELLPVPYYHVVFTLPALAAEIAFQNKRIVYTILFRAAADALRDIAADPQHLGAEVGAVVLLHTWGQALHHHPHLHCIVPGGGLSLDQSRWIACKPGFFLPVRVLSRRFRTLFLERLNAAFEAGELRFSATLAALAGPAAFAERSTGLKTIEWVVYAKRPFAGPEQVLAYLGRYTHRVAIANSRLTGITDDQVSFTWKDYRHHGKAKIMKLTADEFMRRFLLHTVPDGFHRIRHIGFLANSHRAAKLARCRVLLAAPTPLPALPQTYRERHRRLTGQDLDICPDCGGPMKDLGPLPRRPPPRPPFWCDSS